MVSDLMRLGLETAAPVKSKAGFPVFKVSQTATPLTRADVKREEDDDKRNADYAVAKEKCDKLADDAKTACIKDAKVRYGQS